jgi:Bor protein
MISHTLGRHTACAIRHHAPGLPGRGCRAARPAWRGTSWSYARAVVLALLLASAPGCYHYQVAAAGPAGANPSTFPQSATLHAVLWGLGQDQTLEHVCAQDEALARVRTTSNFGYTLLTVVTLGMWAPVQVEYACANPTPAPGTIGGGTRR